MREHPILFSGAMVRAILDGRKTQTRRVITQRNSFYNGGAWSDFAPFAEHDWERAYADKGPSPAGNPGPYLHVPIKTDGDELWPRIYPRWQPSDRLWVRESGWERPERSTKMMREGADTWRPYYYDADGETGEELKAWGFRRRPSIHMPRWASRITLEITKVRVEPLNDISASDAIAEGSQEPSLRPIVGACWSERQVYAKLWKHINGDSSWSWASNPFVWVIEFRRTTA